LSLLLLLLLLHLFELLQQLFGCLGPTVFRLILGSRWLIWLWRLIGRILWIGLICIICRIVAGVLFLRLLLCVWLLLLGRSGHRRARPAPWCQDYSLNSSRAVGPIQNHVVEA